LKFFSISSSSNST